MDTVYILMEEGWEYNDETFFHPESGSGTPTKVYMSLEAAEKERDRRNVESFRKLFTSGEAIQYFYNISDIIPYQSKKDPEYRAKLESLVVKIFGMTTEDLNERLDAEDELKINPDATDDDWLGLQSMVRMNFWDVVECEKE